MLSGPSWAYVGHDGLHGLWGLLNEYTAWNVLITKIRGTFINFYLTLSVSKSSVLAGLLIYCKPNHYYIEPLKVIIFSLVETDIYIPNY
jgi:hypothetical protein